ncbi:MAG TPA: SDR family oxidoreductase [Xanthomonadales bacterium]|nr:SDR family oxidoreductase [Xanthomonadales bacterium]
MNIFTIGGSGLVGSRIKELLGNKHSFDDLSLTNGVNITDPASLENVKNDTEHGVVILLAAKADVDGCEADKSLGEEGDAWKINVGGVQNVVNACRPTNKKLIYISTDFVFNGENTPEGGYVESDTPNPLNWYATTKFKGEEVVKNSGLPFIIARIAYPYRKEFNLKKDFARAIIDRLKNNQSVAAITDHTMTPTFIDDIAVCIDVLIHHNKTGIFHVTGSQSLTPYDAAIQIAERFGLDKNLISKTTRSEYFAGKAQRPLNVSINNEKIRNLGVEMKTFEEGLESISL